MSAELEISTEEEGEKKGSILMFTMSATGAVVGATVSALVYLSLIHI